MEEIIEQLQRIAEDLNEVKTLLKEVLMKIDSVILMVSRISNQQNSIIKTIVDYELRARIIEPYLVPIIQRLDNITSTVNTINSTIQGYKYDWVCRYP